MEFVGICVFNQKNVGNPHQTIELVSHLALIEAQVTENQPSVNQRKGADNRVLNGAIHFVTLVNG